MSVLQRPNFSRAPWLTPSRGCSTATRRVRPALRKEWSRGGNGPRRGVGEAKREGPRAFPARPYCFGHLESGSTRLEHPL